MVQDVSWGELLHEITKIRKSATPLPAHWFAVEHHEDNGVWVLGIDGSSSEEEVATFTLFAARAMEKAGLRPIPVPLPSEHDPQWDLYRQFIEDGTRQRGEEIDLSNAVPYGLGVIDRDAVDPCTRAWLEELRRDGTAFQFVEGTFSIGGQKLKTFDGEFKDVYQATSIYCKRRLRNEIGARLFTGAGETERTAPEGGLESNAQATHLSSQGESLPPEKVVTDRQADDDCGAGIAEGWPRPESATLDEMADTSKPKTDEIITEKDTGKRRGRRPNPERRDRIRVAINKHGDQWRDHLYEILAELDDQDAPLGDFLGMKIDLCDGSGILVKEWVDLDLADGDQRRRIVDALRKYL